MKQNALFHEDIYEALRTDVMASGGTKVVGSALKPKLPIQQASEWVNNCLNRARPEKFDAEDILFIKRMAKQSGSFATLYFEMDDVGMTHPLPITPEDEQAQLMRTYIETVKAQSLIASRLEKLAGVSR
jgi:hypothetical protein